MPPKNTTPNAGKDKEVLQAPRSALPVRRGGRSKQGPASHVSTIGQGRVKASAAVGQLEKLPENRKPLGIASTPRSTNKTHPSKIPYASCNTVGSNSSQAPLDGQPDQTLSNRLRSAVQTPVKMPQKRQRKKQSPSLGSEGELMQPVPCAELMTRDQQLVPTSSSKLKSVSTLPKQTYKKQKKARSAGQKPDTQSAVSSLNLATDPHGTSPAFMTPEKKQQKRSEQTPASASSTTSRLSFPDTDPAAPNLNFQGSSPIPLEETPHDEPRKKKTKQTPESQASEGSRLSFPDSQPAGPNLDFRVSSAESSSMSARDPQKRPSRQHLSDVYSKAQNEAFRSGQRKTTAAVDANSFFTTPGQTPEKTAMTTAFSQFQTLIPGPAISAQKRSTMQKQNKRLPLRTYPSMSSVSDRYAKRLSPNAGEAVLSPLTASAKKVATDYSRVQTRQRRQEKRLVAPIGSKNPLGHKEQCLLPPLADVPSHMLVEITNRESPSNSQSSDEHIHSHSVVLSPDSIFTLPHWCGKDDEPCKYAYTPTKDFTSGPTPQINKDKKQWDEMKYAFKFVFAKWLDELHALQSKTLEARERYNKLQPKYMADATNKLAEMRAFIKSKGKGNKHWEDELDDLARFDQVFLGLLQAGTIPELGP